MEDWLKRGKLDRQAIAKTLGVASETFEQRSHINLPTKACDEFAEFLRQRIERSI